MESSRIHMLRFCNFGISKNYFSKCKDEFCNTDVVKEKCVAGHGGHLPTRLTSYCSTRKLQAQVALVIGSPNDWYFSKPAKQTCLINRSFGIYFEINHTFLGILTY